jgi:hypothetical protein
MGVGAVPDYSARIDEQISEILRLRGRVPLDGLPGIDEADAAVLLRRYADIHSAETPLAFDGAVLAWAIPDSAAAPIETPTLSPVEQVLAQPPAQALLDAPPSGARVSRALWLLPLLLGLVGGVIAWALTKDENPRAARSMLVTGVALQMIPVCLAFALAPVWRAGSATEATLWPVSANGRSTFYYFGTAT